MSTLDRFTDISWYGFAARLLDPEERVSTVRVLVVDDHFLFAEMLMLAIEAEPRFEVVGYAANGHEAIELAAWLRPDVVLMDIDMPVMNGIEATPRVLAASPASNVVIVSSSDDPEARNEAQVAGAVGYLSKASSANDLIRAVEGVVCRVIPFKPRLRVATSADQPALH
jgi:DNA-binding NarL/FixJ family response regulator